MPRLYYCAGTSNKITKVTVVEYIQKKVVGLHDDLSLRRIENLHMQSLKLSRVKKHLTERDPAYSPTICSKVNCVICARLVTLDLYS